MYQFWTFDMDQLVKKTVNTAKKEGLKRSKIAKVEIYLLEKNEDLAPAKGHNFTDFCMVWGANWPFTLQSQQNLISDFGELYIHSL